MPFAYNSILANLALSLGFAQVRYFRQKYDY